MERKRHSERLIKKNEKPIIEKLNVEENEIENKENLIIRLKLKKMCK